MHPGTPGHPTLKILHMRFWGGPLPILLLWLLKEMVDIWPQLWWSSQVKIQEILFLSIQLWIPPGSVILKERSRAPPWLHLVVPSGLPLRSSSAAIPTPGVSTGPQLTPSDGPAQPFYLFFQGSCSSQSLLMGFSHLSKIPLGRFSA